MERFCTNCKWCFKGSNKPPMEWTCLYPDNIGKRTDPVTGEKMPLLTHCTTQRQGPLGCGETGRWWEAA